MLEMLKFVVTSIVKHKEDVSVEEKQDGRFKIYNVKVNPADMGSVIGKGGNTAQAIRTVVKSMNSREKVVVKFNQN